MKGRLPSLFAFQKLFHINHEGIGLVEDGSHFVRFELHNRLIVSLLAVVEYPFIKRTPLASCRSLKFRHPGMLLAGVQEP